MSQKIRNRETGVEKVVSDDAFARLTSIESPKFGGPLWVPTSGKVEVAVQSSDGQVRTRSMAPDQVWQARQKRNPSISVLGGNRAEVQELVRQQELHASELRAADDMGLATFAANAAPGSRALARQFLPGDLADDAGRLAEIQDQQNRGAAAAGTGAGVLLSLALPIPGLGALRAGAGAKSAMSLMKFADETGQVIAGALSRGEKVGTLATMAGRGVAGIPVSVTANTLINAAQIVDHDRDLTYEAMGRDLGNAVLLGVLADTAVPGFGAAARGLAGATSGAIGKLASFPMILGAVGGVGKSINKGIFAARTARGVRNLFRQQATKNGISKVAAGEALTDAASASQRFGAAVDDLRPSKATTSKKATKIQDALDEVAVHSPEIASSPLYQVARDGAENLAGISNGVDKVRLGMDQSAGRLEASLRSPEALRGVSFRSASDTAALEYQMVVQDILGELRNLPGTEAFVKELQGSVTASLRGAPAKGARNLLGLRNRVLIDAAGDPLQETLASIVKRNVDAALTDSRLVGDAAETFDKILRASDDAIDSVSALRAGGRQLKEGLDTATTREAFGVGRTGVALSSAERAAETLADLGVIKASDAGFAATRLQDAANRLGRITPDLETAGAVNALRANAAADFQAVLGGKVDASPEGMLYTMVESAARYTAETAAIVGHVVDHPASRIAWKGGVYKYRNMESAAEKEQEFNEVRDLVLRMTSSEDVMIGRVGKLTENMQADPAAANGVAFAAVQRAQYLRSRLPTRPEGLVPYHDQTFSPAERSAFLDIVGSLDDPLSVMVSGINGELKPATLQAVSDMYPNMLADMRVQLAQVVIADQDSYLKMTYRQRLGINAFLGGGFEPSAQPQALVTLQSRAAQTQAQETALRGSLRQPQPGALPASDRLASF